MNRTQAEHLGKTIRAWSLTRSEAAEYAREWFGLEYDESWKLASWACQFAE
jgi:hypothetical protein